MSSCLFHVHVTRDTHYVMTCHTLNHHTGISQAALIKYVLYKLLLHLTLDTYSGILHVSDTCVFSCV